MRSNFLCLVFCIKCFGIRNGLHFKHAYSFQLCMTFTFCKPKHTHFDNKKKGLGGIGAPVATIPRDIVAPPGPSSSFCRTSRSPPPS